MSVSKSAFDCLVFDLDGTLTDSAGDITRVVDRTFAEIGRRALDVSEIRGMVGDGTMRMLRAALAATGGEPADGTVKLIHDRFLEIYFEEAARPSVAYDGVVETLAALKAAGYRLGVCTNKPERITARVLDVMGFSPYLDAFAGGDTLEVRKPDGRHLAWVVDRLGGGRTVMIGDGGNDVLAARAAGAASILMSYGYPKGSVHDLGADIVLDSFSDLPAALLRLPNPA